MFLPTEELHDKHLEMVRAVNDAKTEREHREADLRLQGFRACADIVCCESFFGEMLMAADVYYANAGIGRPMCCGVWLDWKAMP